MAVEKFDVRWDIDDGYVGSRPHHFDIREDEFEDESTDQDLIDLFWNLVEEDLQQRVSPISEDETRFVAWAKERIAARK